MPFLCRFFCISKALPLAIVATLLSNALVARTATAASVTLRWDYTVSGAAGFVLYCGPLSGSYRVRIDVGNTDTYTIANLAANTTSFCSVTAYDSSKSESGYSNEITVHIPPTPGLVPLPR